MEIIDNTLNNFMNNPYNKEYLINFDPLNENHLNNNMIFSKEIVAKKVLFTNMYSNKYKKTYYIHLINTECLDSYAFAIKSLYKKTVLCKIDIGGCEVQSFIIEPSEIKWIFDGMPFLFNDLEYHEIQLFCYNIDNSIIELSDIQNIIFYYSFLPLNFSKDTGGHLCNINEDQYFISGNGMGWTNSKKYTRMYTRMSELNTIEELSKITFHPKDKLNYGSIVLAKERCSIYKEELLAYALHPDRIFANFNSETHNFREYMNTLY